jgi:uncharacterized protein
MLDKQQYGDASKFLGRADYNINTRLSNGRSLYTFSMCSGGDIINTSSEEKTLVVHGTSNAKQNKLNANTGLLVSVTPKDFQSSHPLAGIKFQEQLEKKAFELGGSDNKAPIQLLGDFLENKETTEIGTIKPSYKPGVAFADLTQCLPSFISESIKEGITEINSKLNNCLTNDSILTGVETRSSSPIMINRDYTTFESNIKGVYPCGEGSGHCSGIVATAVDGIKCAEAIIRNC